MRVVVFSDTHGNGLAVEKIIQRNKDVSHFVFCGDGYREVISAKEKYPDKNFYIARGNCDFGEDASDYGFLELCGHKILYTHGHLQGVNFSYDRLITLALYNNCDIICYGHLHERHCEYRNGVYIFSPSSASLPRDGKKPCYGFLDLEEKGVMMSHADL